jgi:hypothetical protein
MALAGKSVKVRFRIGTDVNGGAPGWDIDNISFGGPQFSSLSNTPFGAIVANAGTCSDGGTGMPDAGPRPDAGTTDARTDTTGPISDAAADRAGDGGATSDATTADGSPADAARDTTTQPPFPPTTGGGGGTTDDGCDCSVPGRRSSSGSAAMMLGILGAISTVLRRRRRNTH